MRKLNIDYGSNGAKWNRYFREIKDQKEPQKKKLALFTMGALVFTIQST